MAYGDDTFSMLGDDSLFMPSPLDAQAALAANVRRNPALVTPSSGVQTPKPRPPAQAPAEPVPTGPTSADLLRQITEQMHQRPDTSAYVQQAKARGDQSDRDLVLALTLGAQGGEKLSPFAGQFLQRSMKDSGDYEIPGGWGTVGRGGEVVWNPAKLQENELARMTKLYDITSGEETKREVARQRAEDRKEARVLRETLAGNSADQRGEQQRWRTEDQTRNHFDQITKDTRDVLNQGRVLQQLPPDGKLSPLQVQSLMILLNKFQDPGSVVREGEFDRVANAQALLQKWGNIPAKIATGQPLPPAMVRDLQATINVFMQSAENTMRATAADYIRLAQQRRLDPAQIVTDPRWHPQAQQQQPGAGRGRGTADAPLQVRPRAPGATPPQVIDSNL